MLTETEDQRILAMIERDVEEADAQMRRWQGTYAELVSAREAITRLRAEHPGGDLPAALEAAYEQIGPELEGAKEDLRQAQERVCVLRGVLAYLDELR